MREYKDYILAWLTFSVLAPIFANRMQESGLPYRDTLGWAIVSTGRFISYAVNGVLIAGALLVGFHWLMTREEERLRQSSEGSQSNAPPPKLRAAQVDEEAIRIRQQREHRRIESEREERAHQERQLAKLAKDLAAAEEARRRLEEKRTRTFTAAVEAALEDF